MRRLIGLVACLMLGSLSAHAYGPTGHRVIAEIASHHLTPTAAKAVKELLGNEFMAEAATWPDEMRADPDKFWQETASPWHYINVPKGQTYEESVKNPAGDALTALKAFTKTLKDKTAPKAERVKALRFISHIVGDLHQPLHTGRPEDHGGNLIPVVWFGVMSNLHKVWDVDLIQKRGLSYTEWTRFLDAKITPEEIKTGQNSKPIDWVHEDMARRDGS